MTTNEIAQIVFNTVHRDEDLWCPGNESANDATKAHRRLMEATKAADRGRLQHIRDNPLTTGECYAATMALQEMDAGPVATSHRAAMRLRSYPLEASEFKADFAPLWKAAALIANGYLELAEVGPLSEASISNNPVVKDVADNLIQWIR